MDNAEKFFLELGKGFAYIGREVRIMVGKKEEWMNPTIGIVICKDKDEIEAQYSLESSSQPLGISSYELSQIIPDEYRGTLPSIEEIEAELERS